MVKYCIRLDGIVEFFHAEFPLPVVDCVHVNLFGFVSCVSTPSVRSEGTLLFVKVCRRKLAGTEESSKHLDRADRETDLHDDCEWITASRRLGRMHTTKFGFGAVV